MKNAYEVRGDVTAICLLHQGEKHEALIETMDLEKVCAFRNTFFLHNGYAEGRYFEDKKPTHISLHRLILDYPDGFQVDHINHNRLDNRRSNLRAVTLQENICNAKGARADNTTSGHRGVSWNRRQEKWVVQVRVKGELKYKRLFEKDNLESAIDAAEQARAYYMPTSSDARKITNPDIEKYGIQKKHSPKSGHKNVYWLERNRSWKIQFSVNKKMAHFGYFKELSDAVREAEKIRKTLA
jgi:hypothetical protein